MRTLTALLIALLALAACGAPVSVPPPAQNDVSQAVVPAKPTPDHTGATTNAGTVVPSQPNEAGTVGAHSYEGDSANSITVQAGDVFTIRNPDFSRGYAFRIVSIEPGSITVATDEPGVTIKDNGTEMPYFIDDAHSMDTGYELPIGWARFTPREKTPVVQTYSMQPGGTVAREGDEN